MLFDGSSTGVPLLHDNIQAMKDSETIEHAMIVLDALRPAQEAASQVWLWISGQIMACEEHVRVLKIRSRFFGLS